MARRLIQGRGKAAKHCSMRSIRRAAVVLFWFGLPLFTCNSVVALDAHFDQMTPTATAEDHLRYQLFVRCQPIWMKIQEPSTEAQEASLTKLMLEKVVESRLRASGIYANSMVTPGGIEVEVRSGSTITSVHLVFLKLLYDPSSRLTGLSETWTQDRVFLTKHGNQELLLTLTANMLESFLKAFFEVNGPACARQQ